jgi:hypothetical protein
VKMTRLPHAVFAATFIVASLRLGPLPRSHNCDALLESQMAQCVGLTGTSYRNCRGHAMAVYTQCLNGAH